MPLLETKGAASAQGFGLTLQQVAANYIEDVFSTWLYAGNNATNTITNGIDLSTKGGLVWIKGRQNDSHVLFDTARGTTKYISSNAPDGQQTAATSLTAFNTNGFTLGADSGFGWNWSGGNFVSWTFRKQPKFFDVVTWTGTGAASRAISHSLESVPGSIIIKRYDANGAWWVYHRSVGFSNSLFLNSTGGLSGSPIVTAASSTTFTVEGTSVNIFNETYVAYLFAHDAGGFGLTGTDNVISCGSFTTDSGGVASVTLGYEPQWVMTKNSSGTSAWRMFDTMRGMPTAGQNDALLQANSSAAEITNSDYCSPTATGFEIAGHSGSATHIYIAIRRGPMKTPTTGTSVFSPNASSAGTGTTLTTNFPTDLQMQALRTSAVSDNTSFFDRLRGFSTTPTNETGQRLISSAAGAETSPANQTRYFTNTGFQVPSNWGGSSVIYWNFRRAPGFFDVVCYTGSPVSVNHNLGVTPEMIIAKSRADGTGPDNWAVATSNVNYLSLNLSNASLGGGVTLSATSTTFDSTTVRTADNYFAGFGGVTAVAYLFASCPGVSKVGSYTGTGTTQQINCGFTGGARFVLIKRTSGADDWFVWDTARGIVSGDDPYLTLNTTAAEETTINWINTHSPGFELTGAGGANLVNLSGSTYIFLAIA
jgi:hypothetical protein